MACFVFENKRVHYEEYGRGKPLVVLNGIMMSCASWAEFIEPFSAQNRLILVDFLDQGKSDRMEEGSAYTQALQVELTAALLDHLELDQVVLMGISYGGEVALQFAAAYGERVERLILFNTTARTGPWLGDIGDAWNLAVHDPDAYYLTTIPVIYSPGFYLRHNDWMNRRREILRPLFGDPAFTGAMVRLTNSAAAYDVTDRLHEIQAPTLVVSCQQDYLTPVEEQQLLAKRIPNSEYVVIPGCGHASMYEKPLLFSSLVLGFANVSKTGYHIV